uniref:Uncharacterized protein n=1 Tax=Quercus lobata TaxID=97700 RepID=A0A7N2N6U0_QUELO
MPSKRMSSACVDYVPALCTHRPSLLPIEWLGEAFGLAQGGRQRPPRAGKLVKPGHLEEVKVVTRIHSESSKSLNATLRPLVFRGQCLSSVIFNPQALLGIGQPSLCGRRPKDLGGGVCLKRSRYTSLRSVKASPPETNLLNFLKLTGSGKRLQPDLRAVFSRSSDRSTHRSAGQHHLWPSDKSGGNVAPSGVL